MKQVISTTPLGPISLVCHNEQLIKLAFDKTQSDKVEVSALLTKAERQLNEYFNKSRESFDLALQFTGTDLQEMVWKELANIPYGTTVSYAAFAEKIKLPHAVRAVANAIGKNPLPVIIPCHRVVGKNGSLTGYIGGTERKRWLIDLEAGQKRLF